MTYSGDLKHPGLLCRMQRFVACMQVAVVVYGEYPATDFVVVTVMDTSAAFNTPTAPGASRVSHGYCA